MSLKRSIGPLTCPSHPIYKLASSPNRTTSQPYRSWRSTLCRSCFAQQWQDRRNLSTVVEYRPYRLESPPLPPRNSNILETSIAGISPEINISRPLGQNLQHESVKQDSQTLSVPEIEARKSKTVMESTIKTERKSRLRSRKAAISLTPSAAIQLRNLLNLPEPKYIRVGVKNRGCSGLAYHLEYVEKAAPFDETVEQDGAKVLIDSKALFSIIGSEMDWVEDRLNQRFVFRNPNIKEQCGCGESFMV